MAVRRASLKSLFSVWGFALSISVALVGCHKNEPGEAAGTATVVALTGNDIKPDGTLSEQAIKAIEKESARSDLTISFLRSRISDGALSQLAKYPNVHRIEASGSTLSDQAVAKLKASNPNVVVVK
jgi:hypothetical protein